MSYPLKTIFLIALMAMAAPLSAQDTETPTDQTGTEANGADESTPQADGADDEEGEAQVESAPAPGAAPGLSMGEEVDTEGNRIGETYTAETFGDWEQRCVRTEDGADPCQLYQLLRDGEGNAVAEISIFPLPEDQQAAAGATIITPLETLLTRQITLSVDDGAARRYPFEFCLEQGCFSRVGFTDAEILSLQRGAQANIVIVPARAPDQEIQISASLSGFTAGYEAVAAANSE